MALNKYHYIELDTKRSPRVSLQNIVEGETGNRIWITLYNNGEKIDLSEQEDGAPVYRVCLRVDSDLGTRRQDSSIVGNGITLISDNTGDHGKCNIRLSKDSFTAGLNRCRLEIFTKQWTTDDTLICSAEWTFYAAPNPTGVNAGNVYPSLIEAENECREATAAALAAAALVDANGVPLLLTSDSVEWDGDVFSCAIEESYDDVIASHSDDVYRPLMIIVDGYLLHERSYSFSGTNLTVRLSTDTGIQGGGVTASLSANSTYHTVGVIGYKTHLETPLYLNYSDGFSYNDLKEAWDENRQVYLIETLNGYDNYKAMYRLSHLDYDGSTYYAGFIGSTFQTWRTSVMVTCWSFTASDPDEEMTES